MRAFWIVLALLAIAGVFASLSTFRAAPTAMPSRASEPLISQPAPAGTDQAATQTQSPAAASPENAAAAAAPSSAPSAAAAPVTPAPVVNPDDAAPSAMPTQAGEPQSKSPAEDASSGAKADAEAKTQAATPTQAPADPASDAAPSAAAVKTTGQKVGGYDVASGKVEKREDGSILLDDKFVVKGDGTKANPYQITWELLTSVDQDFDPHAGKKLLPERIAMMHDKYIKLGGYIAFPMNMQQPKELLLMLNQWDGCCIGVPPTPYDAIEVSLDKTVTGEDRFATTGGVVGKLGIKPYVVGDWLVGLYVMDGGDFSAKFAGTGDN